MDGGSIASKCDRALVTAKVNDVFQESRVYKQGLERIFVELLRCSVRDRHEGHVNFAALGCFLLLER